MSFRAPQCAPTLRRCSIVEQLFLLLRRDDGKAEQPLAQSPTYGLSGAVLADLLLGGHIEIRDGKKPRVYVTTQGSAGHPVLDAAVERLRQKDGKKLSSLVTDGKLNPGENVAHSLANARVIRIEPKRALGLISARYPVLDPGPERELRERLRAVIAGATPDAHEAILLSLLLGMDLAQYVLKEEKGSLENKELKRRIEEVSDGGEIGAAVAKAIEEVRAAVMAAAITAATVGAASSS